MHFSNSHIESSKQQTEDVRIGYWEADTVIGKNHRQTVVNIVERKPGGRGTNEIRMNWYNSFLAEPGLFNNYTTGDQYGRWRD
jgi:IS30 family transposase